MLVQTRKQYEAARTILLDAEIVALDTETSGLYVWKGHRMAGFSIFTEIKGRDVEVGYYFPFRHTAGDNLFDSTENLPIEWLQELKPLFEEPKRTWLFHNSRFDKGMFRAESIKIPGPFYDVMYMSYLCDENISHNLENLYDSIFGANTKKLAEEIKAAAKKAGKGTARYDKLNPGVIEPYAVQDVRATWRLYHHYKEELEKQEMWHLWEQEMEFGYLLHEMEWYGILIDLDLAAKLSLQTKTRMREVEDKLGFDPQKLNLLAKKLYYKPPEGLGFVPGPLTKETSSEFPKGRPVMDEEILAAFNHPTVDLVLEYRGLVKANSTWYEGFLQKADSRGRLHPDWKQHGTKTTRLSCSTPNMQQLPRDIEGTPARRLLLAPPGFSLWEFDYNQIELRLGAIYANEPLMLEAFKRGDDVHQVTASALGIQRYVGKTTNFLVIYGGGAERLMRLLNTWEVRTKSGRIWSLDECAEILKAWHEQFPGFRRTAYKALETAKVRGWVKLWTGHRRHLSDPSDWHKAFNRIVQGGAAQIVQRTMLMFYREPDFDNRRLVAQVHDSLVFELNSEWAERGLAQMIKSMMEWPTADFPIPFPVEMKKVA